MKSYNKRTVVKGVESEVIRARFVGLLGLTGAGKTTSFYMITGLIEPTAEMFSLMMRHHTWKMHERARGVIAYLPQEPPYISATHSGRKYHGNLGVRLPISQSERKVRLQNAADEFSLNHVLTAGIYPFPEASADGLKLLDAGSQSSSFYSITICRGGSTRRGDIQKNDPLIEQRGIGVLITDHMCAKPSLL